jgi:hypothetical protein
VAQFKSDRLKQRLAAFDVKYLAVSLFNTSIAVVDTLMSDVEKFIKRTNVMYFTSEQALVCLDIRIHKGLLLAYYMHFIKVIDVANGCTLTHVLDLGIGFSPICSIRVDYPSDTLLVIRRADSKVQMLNLKIDVTGKKFVEPYQNSEVDENKTINDIDMCSKHILATATGEGEVKLRRMAALGKPYYLNCGSKTMRTYREHPFKKGVSLIKASTNKILVVLGNLIRVYSFDFTQ